MTTIFVYSGKDYCKIGTTKGQPNAKASVSSKDKTRVPRRTRRAIKHFPGEPYIRPEGPKLANFNPQPAERPREWPYLEPDAADDETDTEIIEPDPRLAGPLTSSINTPEVLRKLIKPIQPKPILKALNGPILNEIRPVRRPNDLDVVKRVIDPLFANIPYSPFSSASRWAFQQRRANIENSRKANVTPSSPGPALVPVKASLIFKETVSDKDLAEAKHSDNWWKRNSAVTHIVKRTFSVEFNKMFQRDGEFMETKDFPDEAARFKQLLLDYRIDDD